MAKSRSKKNRKKQLEEEATKRQEKNLITICIAITAILLIVCYIVFVRGGTI